MSIAAAVYAETFARVRVHLCDEVPGSRRHKGVTVGEAIDLDAHADWITRRVLKARGFKENPSETLLLDEKTAPRSE